MGVYLLLFSLATLLSLLLLGWLVFYLFLLGGDENSRYYRSFNRGHESAITYFSKHENFLLGLRNSIQNKPIDQEPLKTQLSIYASALEPDTALMVLDPLRLEIQKLQGRPVLPETLSGPLSELLQAIPANRHNEVVWEVTKDALYLLTPYNPDKASDQRWLGLKLPLSTIRQALTPQGDLCCQSFMLKDNAGRVLLQSSPQAPTKPATALITADPDTFNAVLVDGVIHMQLARSVNRDGWVLSYSTELSNLLYSLRIPISTALLFGLAGSILLFYLLRLLNRQVLHPIASTKQPVQSNAFTREIIDLAPIGLCILRLHDGSLVRANLMAREWMDGHYEKLLSAAQKNALQDIELLAYNQQQTYVHVSFSHSRFQGEPVLLCALSDVSTSKQTQHALAEAKRFAEEANNAKTEFLARMSHEIRTPLYGVLGNLEMLALTKLDRSQKQQIQTIQRSSQLLLQILNDILDLSKIEAGELLIEPQAFSLPQVMENVFRTFAGAARAKGLPLYLQVAPDFPLTLSGDPLRIQQVLSNLLGNAIKFTQQGHVSVSLQFSCPTEKTALCLLDVSDTGIGVSQHDQVRLFDPFVQANKQAIDLSYRGTGLGLPICLQLTKLMQGNLSLQSELGQGSTFTLQLPLSVLDHQPWLQTRLITKPVAIACDNPAYQQYLTTLLTSAGASLISLTELDEKGVLVQVEMAQAEGLSHAPAGLVRIQSDAPIEPECIEEEWYISSASISGILEAVRYAQQGELTSSQLAEVSSPQPLRLKILVAEDHPANQLLLRSQLESLGCAVTIVNNGQEAVEAWEHEAFDCTLTDINMPVMDGYELTQTLRTKGISQPIFGVSASAMPEDTKRCREAGMTAHLAKPVSVATLRQILQDHCFK